MREQEQKINPLPRKRLHSWIEKRPIEARFARDHLVENERAVAQEAFIDQNDHKHPPLIRFGLPRWERVVPFPNKETEGIIDPKTGSNSAIEDPREDTNCMERRLYRGNWATDNTRAKQYD